MEARAGAERSGRSGGMTRGGDDHGRAREWDRIAGVAGFVFTALLVASFFTPSTPMASDPPDQIVADLLADRTGHQWSLLLGFLADIAVFVLLAGLWSRLRRWEGPAGLLTDLFALAAGAFMAVILVSEGLYLTLVQNADDLEPSSVQTLSALDNSVGAAIFPAGAALFLGVGAAIVSTRALPAWLGWLAALTALVLVVGITGVFEDSVEEDSFIGIVGFAGFILMVVWLLAASIVLFLRAGGDAPYEEARAESRRAT
ncbi:hypothetical protein DQ239_19800 [Blastococcus sp. TF02-09]|uniref:DUF4386 family protein n=1 Tax=Blastococcus sp. TF02-09 TaxID=2250576 RepID=UPI000DE991BC|nr:DUF4386 family protein [Blastococcus sp. TF02-9]RBY74416.1 hypothetical protein DQ239_19800 [Blastococcus sp. TF02-9]